MYHVTITKHVTDVNNRVTSYSALRFQSLCCSFADRPNIDWHVKLTKHNFDTHQSVTDMI